MRTNELFLEHNQPLRIERAGVTVECTAGSVWITNPILGGDLFLRGGERQCLPGGATLIEALGSARIVLHPPPVGWRGFVTALWGFLLSYAHGRASQYKGIYLRTVQPPRRRDPLAG